MADMRTILERAELNDVIDVLIEAAGSECMQAFMDPDSGRFKGGKGERFDNCVKAFSKCKPEIEDPEAMCAKIARAKGLAANESLHEAVQETYVTRMARAMLKSPMLDTLLTSVFDEDQKELFDGMIQQPLVDLLSKALSAMSVNVSASLLSRAGREMKVTARKGLSAEPA